MKPYTFLLLLTLKVYAVTTNRISASGGGIVKPGDDLTLTFSVGAEWERCFWFHYEDDSQSKESHCSFDFVKDTGNVSLHRCDPDQMSSVMIPSGNDTGNCEITITGVDDTNEGVWAARLDTHREAEEVKVVVAEEMEGLALKVDVMEGQEGNISCSAVGGKPAPIIDVQFVEGESEETDKTVNSEDNSNGFLLLTPSMKDHGRKVVCTARQLDGHNETLFTREVNGNVDVSFPPRPQAQTTTITAQLSATAIIPVTVVSNPPPSSVNWVVDFCQGNQSDEVSNKSDSTIQRNDVSGENNTNESGKEDLEAKERDDKNSTACKQSFPLGYRDDKYTASNISSHSDPLRNEIEFEIANIEEKDYAGKYSVIIQNDIGSQEYTFQVAKLDEISNTTIGEIVNHNITNTTITEIGNNITATEISTDNQNTSIKTDNTGIKTNNTSMKTDHSVRDSSSSFVVVVAVLGTLGVLVLLLILLVLVLTVHKVRQGTLTVTPAPEDHGKDKPKENNNKVVHMELVET